MNRALTRIGIFFDGSFFQGVSAFYAHHHPRRARLSLGGIREFVRNRVAQEEATDVRLCQVVEAHYFRGRFSPQAASDAGALLGDRIFDDVLMREGIMAHYLPIGASGTEKGVDVLFALETYQLAVEKRFDVCVLVACDSDYLPLVCKLNALGVRVMLLGWDFEYTDNNSRLRTTKTSQSLLAAVSYPLLVSSLVEDEAQSQLVSGLFVSK